jgi:hypothetical protein
VEILITVSSDSSHVKDHFRETLALSSQIIPGPSPIRLCIRPEQEVVIVAEQDLGNFKAGRRAKN